MTLLDACGEDALDVLADLLEPVSEIAADKAVVSMVRAGNHIQAVATAIRGHKRAVLNILAIARGENPATYRPGVLELPAMLLEILNHPTVMELFSWQSQDDKTSSGSATESIEAQEQ